MDALLQAEPTACDKAPGARLDPSSDGDEFRSHHGRARGGENGKVRVLTRLGWGLSLYALMGGFLGLIGWFGHLPRLTDWIDSGIPIYVNAAFAVVCSSLAILFRLKGGSGAGVVTQSLGFLVMAIGAATLFEHLSGINFGIDTLLISQPWGGKATVAPGRMGPPASLSFLLLGLTLLLAEGTSRLRRLAPVLGIAVVAITLLPVIGYLFNADPLFAIAKYTGIALQTATMLLALGLAVLASLSDLKPMTFLCGSSAASLLARRALPFVFLIPITLGWVFIQGRNASLFDRGMGMALLVLSLIALLCALVWWCVADVARHERFSQRAERELQRKNEQLASFLEAGHRELAERKRVEAALRVSEELYRATFENAAVGIAHVALDGRWLRFNPAVCAITGFSPEELRQRTFAEITHPDDRESDWRQARRLIAGEVSRYQIEKRYIRKDASAVWVMITVSLMRDSAGAPLHFIGIIENIEERKQAQESAARLAAIVENSNDAILSANLEGQIQSWNPAARRLYGYTADEAIGRPITLLIPQNCGPEEAAILDRVRQGDLVENYETTRRRKDGTLFNVSLTVSPIRDGQGQVIGVSKVARDISERVRAREILEQTVAERTASLREALGQMEEFSYSVSHDLRAPLRAMNAYAGVLVEEYGECLDETARGYLQKIQRGSDRMNRLTQDVLAYSRVARSQAQPEAIDLDRLVRDVIHQYTNLQPPMAEIELVSPLLEVLGHEATLGQVISNLLNNAVKFVPPGVTPSVRIWSENEGKDVRVWFADNGIGIKPEHQERIFQMFERVHPDGKYEGTGIGLTIVRKAIEKMSGKVGVQSDGQNGSRFWIELPGAGQNK